MSVWQKLLHGLDDACLEKALSNTINRLDYGRVVDTILLRSNPHYGTCVLNHLISKGFS